MTKKQFIKLLVLGNLALVILVVTAGVGGWFLLNKLPSINDQAAKNHNQGTSDSLVLGLSTFDSPAMLYRQSDNKVKILIYQSAINYQEVFQLDLANTALPIEVQIIGLDSESIAYLVDDFNTQTVRKYSFAGEATDIYRTNANIKGIRYYSNFLYILVEANNSYSLIRSDLQGKEVEIVEFSSSENWDLNFINSQIIELKDLASQQCSTIALSSLVLTASESCTDKTVGASLALLDHYRIFSRYLSATGEYTLSDAPVSYPVSYPTSYPVSYPQIQLKQFVYSKEEVQKAINLSGSTDETALNLALLDQSYIFESLPDFQLDPIFSSEQISLLIESGLQVNEKNLIAIYPDTKTERMRLPVLSDVEYLGTSKDNYEVFLASRTNVNGLVRDGIISFNLKSRVLQEYALPQCQPNVINCSAGLLN